MPTLLITNQTAEPVDLRELYVRVFPGIPITHFVPLSTIQTFLDLLKHRYDGEVSVAMTFLPEELDWLSQTPTRQNIGTWAKENLAAGLVDSPMVPPELSDPAFAEKIMVNAGSITGMYVQVSEAPAGSALTLRVSINGVPQASNTSTIPIAGDLKNVFSFDPVAYDAGDSIGIMVSTGGGWTSIALDVLAGLIIQDGGTL